MLGSFKHWFLMAEADDALPLSGQSVTLYHGCTTSSAHNIINKGLQDRSQFDIATNMSGEFWATNNYGYASLMSFMPGYNEASPDDPPVVLQFELPVAAIRRMQEGKHYEQHGLGTYEFKARAFNFLNRQIGKKWKIVGLEPSAAHKWNQQLAAA